MEFGEKVKKLMDEAGMSQKTLARESGISESSICRYLSGELKPRMDVASNIAKALGVTTSYLLGEEEGLPARDSFKETVSIVTRNRKKLSAAQKAEIIKILFGEDK